MSDHNKDCQLEGVVRARHYDASHRGKQFLGAAIVCNGGTTWVIDYDEQSPFHPFNGRQVVLFGRPYQPAGQHLIGWTGAKTLGHFRVSTMRVVEATPDTELVEVGAGQELVGRFHRRIRQSGDSTLSFVSEQGREFLVANDPAGAVVGSTVEVCAYPVQFSSSSSRPGAEYLWIISPCTASDLWEWRERHSCER